MGQWWYWVSRCFYMVMGIERHQEQHFFFSQGNHISRAVQFVSDMLYIKSIGLWCNIIVWNVHVPTEDKSEDKSNFYAELEQALKAMTYSTSSCLVTKLWIHGMYICMHYHLSLVPLRFWFHPIWNRWYAYTEIHRDISQHLAIFNSSHRLQFLFNCYYNTFSFSRHCLESLLN
jgi:hypothetical protein